MKAVIWTRYGPPDVLQLQEVPTPLPKEDEIQVRIHATTVTAGDCEMRTLKLPLFLGLPMRLYTGLRKPVRLTILGQELAGEVTAVGRDVQRFAPGDRIFAATGFGLGGYAEYICLPAENRDVPVAHMPANMSYVEAAAVPLGGLEALHFLRGANLQPGESMLINGAGGSIGTMGVQLAKHYGAEVTAVDHRAKLDMLRRLGADHVIDYTQEDFTRNGQTYDVIFDVVGKSNYGRSVAALRENGRYLIANPTYSGMLRGAYTSRSSSKTVHSATGAQRTADLVLLRDLIEAGHLCTVIDRTYPLAQAAEAHRYVETGRKAGNVILTVA
jgi:NADPH:quinone reductase-like Zn-dependent oxidoreductase